MSKRGISPLIASVLLIVFVVTLFLVVTSFTRETIDETLEKGDEQLTGTLDCLSARLEIADVSKKSDNTQVKYSIDNTGEVSLENIRVRIIGSTGVTLDTTCGSTEPLERCVSTGLAVSAGTIESIEAVPELESGLCTSSIISKKVSKTY